MPGAWASKWKRSLGAFLLYEHGKPAPPGIFAFAGGALAAMMRAILLGIGGPRGRLQPPPRLRAYGAMHPFSVFGAVLSEWPIAAAVESGKPRRILTVEPAPDATPASG